MITNHFLMLIDFFNVNTILSALCALYVCACEFYIINYINYIISNEVLSKPHLIDDESEAEKFNCLP